MSYKDDGAKQTQDYRDRFNHFDAPGFTLLVRAIGDPGFRRFRRGRKMFCPTADKYLPKPSSGREPRDGRH
jgi:hypothetical protein